MPGPPPKEQRRRRNVPAAGEWQPAPGYGWQHGKTPPAPPGLSARARRRWSDWFQSWAASFWKPEDLAAIEAAIMLYDKLMREPSSATATALGQYLDRFGLSPKGRQDRRWKPPETQPEQEKAPAESSYRRLRVIGA